MMCPHCGFDNVPGSEECAECRQDLTQLDQPVPRDRIERLLMEDSVRALDPRAPITARATTTVQEAIHAMLTHDIGALIVTDREGQLLGIFSERDLLTKVAGLHPHYAELPVGQFMTNHPETVSDDHTLAFALHKMDIGGYRHLPVTADGRPIGVVSVRDMLRHITRQCRDG